MMDNSDKVVGVLFVAVALINLLRRDWLGFGLLATAGGSLLIEAKRSNVAKILQIVLGLTAIVLLVTRIVVYLSK